MNNRENLYQRALSCIMSWPDNYEEVAFPEVVSFAKVVLNAPVEIIVRSIELAEQAISNGYISPGLSSILVEFGEAE